MSFAIDRYKENWVHNPALTNVERELFKYMTQQYTSTSYDLADRIGTRTGLCGHVFLRVSSS